jgi:DNA polymerase type B, organellar and viral
LEEPVTDRVYKSWKERGRVDTRTGDRHKPRTDTRRRARPKTFAGLDGESVDGVYTLLAGATDDHNGDGGDDCWIENADGLSTFECLEFITGLPKDWRCWGFAFGYDVNMMLGDLSPTQIQRLYDDGAVYFRDFRIAYVPGKRLTVSRYGTERDGIGKRKVLASKTVWDMFTWIQTSFVAWIEAWSLAPDQAIETIREMKGQRSTFDTTQSRQIRAYCLDECRYLAAGARRLVDLIAAADVKVSAYYSPATISKYLMGKETVLSYRADPPPELEGPIDAAYYGGRAEVSEVGPIDGGDLYQYDIRSAYPAAMVGMPCLKCGYWWHANRPFQIDPWSLVKVSWRPKRGFQQPQWGPLPVRPRTGSLRWPTHGTGWYWGVEVLAAQRHATIKVKDHWIYTPSCIHRPFAYIADLYEQRAALKRAGDPTEFVLKLALNATYGALAEHPQKNRHGEKAPEPKFRCLAWAGWITAATRARLLDVLTDDVLLMATDCVLSHGELDVPIGDQLGEWEVKRYDRMFVAGTGIYYGHADDQWSVNKTRGFESGTLTREMLERLWRRHGRTGTIRMQRHRFIGMGTALHRIHGFYPPYARLWRQFIDEPVDKTLDVEPRRRWLTDDVRDGRSLAPTLASHRALDRADRERLQRLRAEYADKLEVWTEMLETIRTPQLREQFLRSNPTAIRRQKQLLILAAEIRACERAGSSPFVWSDDPNV